MKRRAVLLLALATFALSGTARAQWIVHDPTSYINHLARYQQLLLEYQMFYYEFRGLQNLGNFKNPRSILRLLEGLNLINAQELHRVLNTRRTPAQVDAAVDEALTGVRQARGLLRTARYDPVGVVADLVELMDASTKASMGTIGGIRYDDGDLQLAVKNLEAATAAAYGIESTDKSVLQKINSAAMIQVKQQLVTNQLLLHLLEQQTLVNQQQREAQVSAINLELKRREILEEALAYARNARVPNR